MTFFLLSNPAPRGDYTTIRGIELLDNVMIPPAPKGSRWVPCEEQDLEKFSSLRIENNVRYYGYL